MLENTFCHIPGIGEQAERRLWACGATSWATLNEETLKTLKGKRRELVQQQAGESAAQLSAGNAEYFSARLPAKQMWRMFPHFENSTAYLDIETTGLGNDGDHVTTLALYDGAEIYTYVHGDNLDEFADRIQQYKLLVTYNGKTFDIPFLRRQFGLPLSQAHIDLRYVLASLGYKGGLKMCERRLGLDRHDLAEVDGFFAVMLWRDYMRTRRRETLETLLAYNVADVVNLAVLMPLAYNMKISDTPFAQTHQRSEVTPPASPFQADVATVDRIRRSMGGYF